VEVPPGVVDVGQDRRVDAAEVLVAEVVIAAEVGRHVVVVVDVEEAAAEDVEGVKYATLSTSAFPSHHLVATLFFYNLIFL